jgi:hypothetical protein
MAVRLAAASFAPGALSWNSDVESMPGDTSGWRKGIQVVGGMKE